MISYQSDFSFPLMFVQAKDYGDKFEEKIDTNQTRFKSFLNEIKSRLQHRVGYM